LAVLRPHERTIPRHVDKIAAEIVRDGIQKDPIIVDEDSGAVLDGMHRLAAFEKLGFDKAVCCTVPYSSRSVSVSRWARSYRAPKGVDMAAVLRGIGGFSKATLTESFEALDGKKSGVAAFTGGVAYLAVGDGDLSAAFSKVDALDLASEGGGWVRKFVPEDEVDIEMQDPATVVALVRRITKDDVVTAAKTGRLFPCKTSMHSIDPRPVSVRYPASDLKKEAPERSGAFEGVGAEIMPPGTFYEGRRYKERLLVLRQP